MAKLKTLQNPWADGLGNDYHAREVHPDDCRRSGSQGLKRQACPLLCVLLRRKGEVDMHT